MGLILCKEIIEKHGGEIWYFSEAEAGSEFHFTFPLFQENVLIVGLDNKTADDIKNLFSEVKPSYFIRECANGFEAIDEIKSKVPSVIMLNDKMQLMDGLQFVEILQGENRTAGIPVYLIADDLPVQALNRYHDLGVRKIFNKPLEKSKLIPEIHTI